ncbi:MAG: hypothetical protein HYU97_03345 [Deltaproteobacteria bacterium]|nr:hypothetical protein [Deltaproteobacteria bacterium]
MKREIQSVRRDLSHYLFHWTRRTQQKPASDILMEILEQKILKGSNNYIRGSCGESHKCVCFTETPVSEFVSLFKFVLRNRDKPNAELLRYEPYGIAVKKEWLFKQDGRPVIYQTNAEYEKLPSDLQWRHCKYDP